MRRFAPIWAGVIGMFFVLPAASAFNDDSSYSSWYQHRAPSKCSEGLNKKTRKIGRQDCPVGNARLDKLHNLFQNGVQVTRKKVEDFKVAQNHEIFFRTRNSHKLYQGGRVLNSGASGVEVYLLAPTSDVVYLNKNGVIYKNGRRLNSGKSKVTVQMRYKRRLNPLISSNGKAVYRNDSQALFVDGRQVSPNGVKVTYFKVDQDGNVVYIDKSGKVYRNGRQIYRGANPANSVYIGPQGKVAILTDAESRNLYLDGRQIRSGTEHVKRVWFNSRGALFYEDRQKQRWMDGRRVRK